MLKYLLCGCGCSIIAGTNNINTYNMNAIKFKDFIIKYKYTKQGFPSHITVNSNNLENALKKAHHEIRCAYGYEIFKDIIFI